MARARARHILVETEAQCLSLKDQILAGADFAGVISRQGQLDLSVELVQELLKIPHAGVNIMIRLKAVFNP